MPPSRLFRSIVVFGTALGAGSVVTSGCSLFFDDSKPKPKPDAWHGIIDAGVDGWNTIADAPNDAAWGIIDAPAPIDAPSVKS